MVEARKLVNAADTFGTAHSPPQAPFGRDIESTAAALERDFPLSRLDVQAIIDALGAPESLARELVARFSPKWFLGWRDITNSTNERTLIVSALPKAAVGHTLPLAFSPGIKASLRTLLLANLNSFVTDYIARQKVGGTHITYNLLKQFPILSLDHWEDPLTSINAEKSAWFLSRTLALVYSAHDLSPLARDCSYEDSPLQWDERRRFEIRCELDAAFFHLYFRTEPDGDWRLAEGETSAQISALKRHFPAPRDAVVYILEQFPIVRRKDEAAFNGYRTKDYILKFYDAMLAAQRSNQPYRSRLDPPPGTKAAIMISKVTIQNFKQFRKPTEFALKPNGLTFLAGGNNSGKSTLLQALAVWEFGRTVIELNRGGGALLANATASGVGIGAQEFSPIALPNLKHLWSDLRGSGGYGLRIRCEWYTDQLPVELRYLEVAFALANDRLFVRCNSSNLVAGETTPRMAYLPPFAGIGPREERMIPAARRRLIGRGLAGAVLRNLIYDFWKRNSDERENIKNPSGRIPKAALSELRRTDAWERLLLVLEEVFKIGLRVRRFDELYQTEIEVLAWDGQLIDGRLRKRTGASEKDLMVEGSGFLQWLSVYALALDRDLSVLLLDEPDAHLHPALQGHLVHKLGQLARENEKQVLLATHSTTILGETRVDRIFRMEDRSYLDNEGGRVKLFVGLGSQYAPRLDQLKRCKRLFLHDGISDIEILQAWAKTLGYPWPEDLVCWSYTRDRDAREILFSELRKEIPGLRCISLQDRDDYPFGNTRSDLRFDDLPEFRHGLGLRRWRRTNIENYLLHPAAIARASGRLEKEVRTLLGNPHGLNVTPDFTVSDCPQTLANTNGKVVVTKHARSITNEFAVDYRQIAAAMQAGEIPDDPKTLLQQLIDLCRP